MVKDATASYSDKEMLAALEVNIPNYATAVVTTDEVVDAISCHKDSNSVRSAATPHRCGTGLLACVAFLCDAVGCDCCSAQEIVASRKETNL